MQPLPWPPSVCAICLPRPSVLPQLFLPCCSAALLSNKQKQRAGDWGAPPARALARSGPAPLRLAPRPAPPQPASRLHEGSAVAHDAGFFLGFFSPTVASYFKGGDAKLLVILCVSPSRKHVAETLRCLGLGARVRQVQRGQAGGGSPASRRPR